MSFSGSPSFVSEFQTDASGKFRDNGGPLSPYGSHFGLKAEVGNNEFAAVRHYACTTGKKLGDYSRTGWVGTSHLAFLVDGVLQEQVANRELAFAYYGWTENARWPELAARAQVVFLGTDAYVISARVENITGHAVHVSALLAFQKASHSLAVEDTVSEGTGEVVVARFVVKPSSSRDRNYLALAALPGARLLDADAERGAFATLSEPVLVGPGETAWFSTLFAYSPDTVNQALAVLEEARASFHGPVEAWASMEHERNSFFLGLPPPHLAANDSDGLDLYRMAAAGLDQALYAPRDTMQHWGTVPNKGHYNWFWLWDSGFQALGLSELAPPRARDAILTMFAAQEADGYLAHMADERQLGISPHSQPPVFGFVAPDIMARDPDVAARAEFTAQMYEHGASFLGWWQAHRDSNHNGLFEYVSQDEGGWDNSPRADYVPKIYWIDYHGYLGELIASVFKPLDNVDLNPWIYFYDEAMADWASTLGKSEAAALWDSKARDLAGRVDDLLWDESCGCWLDGYRSVWIKAYQHSRVLTPAIWFPAFAGATLDAGKVRRVIAEHLLNPEEFFGTYPIPIVAYNDPHFDSQTPGWTGSIWLFSAYSALVTLSKYGYDDQAAELRTRLLRMMAAQDGMKGIYETYDPGTGKYKNATSTGQYCAFQFGWSMAFTLEMILERYQSEKLLFDNTRGFSGFVRRARAFADRSPFYRVEAGRELPRVELESGDGQPLLEARAVKLTLDDPYASLPGSRVRVWLRGRSYDLEVGREYFLSLNERTP